jgi:hypothetical protein
MLVKVFYDAAGVKKNAQVTDMDLEIIGKELIVQLYLRTEIIKELIPGFHFHEVFFAVGDEIDVIDIIGSAAEAYGDQIVSGRLCGGDKILRIVRIQCLFSKDRPHSGDIVLVTLDKTLICHAVDYSITAIFGQWIVM